MPILENINYRNYPKKFSVVFKSEYHGSTSQHYGIGGIQIPEGTTHFEWEYVEGTLFSTDVDLKIIHKSNSVTWLSKSSSTISGNISNTDYESGEYIVLNRHNANGSTCVKVTFYFN